MEDLTKLSHHKLTRLKEQLVANISEPERDKRLLAVQRELRNRTIFDALRARLTALRTALKETRKVRPFSTYALAIIEGQIKENVLLQDYLKGNKKLDAFVRDGL